MWRTSDQGYKSARRCDGAMWHYGGKMMEDTLGRLLWTGPGCMREGKAVDPFSALCTISAPLQSFCKVLLVKKY